MFEPILQKLGLSPNEAKIYENLLSKDSINVSSIAVKSNVHRRNVYDCLNKLIEKGLISEIVFGNEKHFKAVNPNRLMALLKDKEDLLNQNLPEMQRRFQKADSKEQACLYKGIQGFKNYMQDILDAGNDVYCIGAKGGWWDKRLEPFRSRFYKEIKKRKINVYHLFDYDMKSKLPQVVKTHEHEAKILPKEYSTNSAIDIFGDHVVTFTGLGYGKLDGDLTQFVIISKQLADSYKVWFKMIWNLLPGKKL